MVLDLGGRIGRGTEVALPGGLQHAVRARFVVGREQAVLTVARVVRPQGRACVEEPAELGTTVDDQQCLMSGASLTSANMVGWVARLSGAYMEQRAEPF